MNSRNVHLILASQSPRRRQLLTDAGYALTVIPPDESVERGVQSTGTIEDFVSKSAVAKAQAVSKLVSEGLILAADTVAECDGHVLGKPVDRNHAEQMLRLMSGKRHQVLTGVCLWHRPSDRRAEFVERTVLRMDALSDSQLNRILDSGSWVGKAGAFGFQDGLDWVHIESGLESNVVGLPIERIGGWIGELLNGGEWIGK